MISIIYIGGYGRSGSTLSSLILSQNANVINVGEICNLPKIYKKKSSFCSCGKELKKCNIWSKLIKELLLIDNKKNFFSYRKFFWEKTFKNISKNNNSKFIVDASKTSYKQFFRPFFLSSICKFKVHYIHLYKPFGQSIKSFERGTNKSIENNSRKRLFHLSRSILGWLLANFISILYMKIGNFISVTSINFESFLDDPKKYLSIISKKTSIELDVDNNLLIGKDPIRDHHIISGNRMINKDIYLKSRSLRI